MGALDGKVAIVTGTTAASIGRACAMGFAMAGAKVVVTGRTVAGGEETETLIRDAGGDALFVRQDVTVEEDWERVIKTTVDTYGRLDFLVNNAGEAIVKPVEELTRDDLIFLRLVDLDGPFLGMKHAWPHLVAAGGGVILNMSSIVGQKTNPRSTAYGAIKGAQLGLTRTGALEGAAVNIRVNSVHPGMIWTAGVPDVLGPDAEKKKPMLAARIPWGETGEPHHVGDPVVYLCSDAGKYITGIEFNIDGGAGAG
ncbi:MAG: SDR family oxidoreductase [Rhodospirillaceae bacterium]|jgi:3(or 17)beta-hydroxysteroid dehydrogenase|nr:SDR family oxidoreductase [Rhodospirillaceae bacterium]MBT5241520.1 SDR family oxidoreductase [Rhodospirillaceae bacterium]MBT5566210.1 SDR family oxidoreductase [Rhodospirillaceae bacterium]MBT6088928.1 SDR family oxidoreductase [Rhodospirillaceae bacterium]MBT6961462.1 SDR family oxidoreductase [Rhodospirillaceae bacterium]